LSSSKSRLLIETVH